MFLPTKRLVWFAAAILVPCAALVYLGLRLLAQEEEITRQRARETMQSRVEKLKREMLAVLEPIRLAETASPMVAFHGLIREGRAILAWELQLSVVQVRRALAESGEPARPGNTLPGAAGDFLLLRQAVDTGNEALFTRLAGRPASVTDDFGVPLALYAIPRLPPAKRAEPLRRTVLEILANPHAISPLGLGTAASLAAEAGLAAEAARLKSPLDDAKAAARFQSDYASLGGASTVRWQSYAGPPYLAGYAAMPTPGEFSFRAVRAGDIGVGARFSTSNGELLGEPFPGLRAIMAAPAQEAIPRQRPFVLAVLAIAVSIALLGGLLWWRDFRREAQIASLRTQFVAGVSHELRTPLTALRMFTEAMHDNPSLDVATRQEYLATMLRENERLSRLVENVLEFSRIERNKQSYQLRSISLPPVIDAVLCSMKPLLDQNGFQLRSEIAVDLPAVEGDPDALGQALANLVGNAMKYSGAAREIRVEARRQGPSVAIRVADRGIGIPVHEQHRIFDSFYRARVPENRSIQGAGLGLTLVRHVMRGHRGEVSVESRPGLGSTFTLLLPIPEEEPIA